jgi:hypothetical protein
MMDTTKLGPSTSRTSVVSPAIKGSVVALASVSALGILIIGVLLLIEGSGPPI